LFLSRIHPKKGLPLLVDAWNQVRPAGWSCTIAGPDDAGHLAEIRSRLERGGLSDAFEFLGPVSGSERWELLRSADLFVLPTHSENFGNVIGEALSCGVPVITTRGAPWEGIPRERCGWWVDADVDSLSAALGEATRIDDDERRRMGRRGRTWIRRDFSPMAITRKMLALYERLAGGPGPDDRGQEPEN
jgi:glycosyltransferase involved in cell wall biosynthesis